MNLMELKLNRYIKDSGLLELGRGKGTHFCLISYLVNVIILLLETEDCYVVDIKAQAIALKYWSIKQEQKNKETRKSYVALSNSSSFDNLCNFLHVLGVAPQDLYMCNPLMQAWRKLPIPLQVQGFDLVHLVINKHIKLYTITLVSNDLQHHTGSAKAIIEVYDSTRKTWSASCGVFQLCGGNNLFYYKKHVEGKFFGIRAYNKTTSYSTGIPLDFLDLDDIIFSEKLKFFPLVEHQRQIYVLRMDAATTSKVWMLCNPSHVWEKLYSVPKPEVLEYYLLLLFVSADAIIIYGDLHSFHVVHVDDMDRDPKELENPFYLWMFNKAQETWIDVTKHGIYCMYWSQIMFVMRLDAVP